MQDNTRAQQIVFVVNNDESIRKSLYDTIKSTGLGVETFANATQFLNLYKPNLSGCLILDGRSPEMKDLHILKYLRISIPHLPIILLANHQDISIAMRAMMMGIFSIIENPYTPTELLSRTRAALQYAKRNTMDEQSTFAIHLTQLTKREKEILELIVAGKASKVIATDLGISKNTVENHRKNIMAKLHTKSVVDLVREYTLHQHTVLGFTSDNQLHH